MRQDLGLTPTLPTPTHWGPTVREATRDLPGGPDGYQIHPKWVSVYARIKPGQSFKDLHPKGHLFSHTRLNADRRSPTILKTVGVARNGDANNGLYHWRYPRLLTIPELKRLGSFPDAYQFASNGNDVDDFLNAWAGIGNSVPPFMTRAIARHIRHTILDQLPR